MKNKLKGLKSELLIDFVKSNISSVNALHIQSSLEDSFKKLNLKDDEKYGVLLAVREMVKRSHKNKSGAI